MFPWDWWNPFSKLGSQAARIAADAWIAAWLSVWNAGLWMLRLVLSWMDAWLTPDLSGEGPGNDLYQTTFWIAGVLMVIMLMVQLGTAAVRRDGKGLGRAVFGLGQFVVIVGGWIGYTVAVTAAVGGLTRACMDSLMNVTSWKQWAPFTATGIDAKTITDGGTAVVLGMLGLLVWLGAIAHLLVILARDAALMVLVATGPIAAAGLANETTRAWFWKTFRWFHAAVFTPLLVVIVTGVGMKFASGVPVTTAGGPEASIGTAVPAVILICISTVAPLALFKLLAFVDPGTASGAAMRAGMAAMGGIQGMLAGNPTAGATAGASGGGGDSDAAQSGGEASAEEATTARAAGAAQMGSSLLGGAGLAFAAGIGAVMKVGSMGASVLTDVANQEGVGHNTYQPDYQAGPGDGAARANREANAEPDQPTQPDQPPADDPTQNLPPGGADGSSKPGGGAGGGGGGSSPGGGGAGKPPLPGSGGPGGAGAGAGGASTAEVAEVAVVAL